MLYVLHKLFTENIGNARIRGSLSNCLEKIIKKRNKNN